MLSFSAQSPDIVLYSTLDNKVAGKLLLGQINDGTLCRLSFMKKATIKETLKQWQKEWPETIFKKQTGTAVTKLSPKMRMHLTGTSFQQDVWKTLLTIPSGQTISYGEMARRIKRPKAVRAVGTALGKNPIPFILPCHRVISSDNSIGGFGSGVNLKKKLLKAEGATI